MTTTARNPRYESLDAWRGLVCGLVVVFHSTMYVADRAVWERVAAGRGSRADLGLVVTSQCNLGVPLFFVISGYCIAATADATRSRGHGTGSYLRRRVRRIYPPVWVLLAGVAVLGWALPPALHPGAVTGLPVLLPRPGDVPAAGWVGAATLTEEWRHHLVGPPQAHPVSTLWTLCYEEQFYLVVGAILLVARRRLFPAVAAVTALVFLNVADLDAMFGRHLGVGLNRFQLQNPGFFFDGLWLAFAAGVGVYYRANHATPAAGRMILLALAGGAVWAARPAVWPLVIEPTLAKYLTVAFAFALVLCGLHRYDARAAAARWAAPLRYCGRMCYSLYLTHYPVCVVLSLALYRAGFDTPATTLAVTLPVCLTASILAGAAFHHLVERHFLNPPAVPKSIERGNGLKTGREQERQNALLASAS